MTRDQIITQLFTGKNFNQCIDRMEPEHLREDLKMEVMAIVCEWPAEKIIGLYERRELDFYVVRVILNQIQSNTSPFFHKYRKFQSVYLEEAHDMAYDGNEAQRRHFIKLVARISRLCPLEDEDLEARLNKEEAEDRVLAEIEGLYWYNAELLKLYVKHGNYRAIEKETGIPFGSCYKTIQKSIKELKEKAVGELTKPLRERTGTGLYYDHPSI